MGIFPHIWKFTKLQKLHHMCVSKNAHKRRHVLQLLLFLSSMALVVVLCALRADGERKKWKDGIVLITGWLIGPVGSSGYTGTVLENHKRGISMLYKKNSHIDIGKQYPVCFRTTKKGNVVFKFKDPFMSPFITKKPSRIPGRFRDNAAVFLYMSVMMMSVIVSFLA